MTRFEFSTAQRIVFGPGVLEESSEATRALGSRPLLVTGRDPARCSPLLDLLRRQGLEPTVFCVSGEPTVSKVLEGAELVHAGGLDVVVAFGGGSALDAGKAIAALASNPGDPNQYLEVIGEGRPLANHPLPWIAIPTTSGTGAEVTRNAVLSSPEHGVKVSLRHAWMLPRVALVDPELTYDLPAAITASTGLDALTQLVEPYVCRRSNPVTDSICIDGMRRVARSLRRAFTDGRSAEAREDMSLASLFGGLALANAGLGAVHGLAGPLGGIRPVPHGVACGALLSHVMEQNVRILREREASGAFLARYEEVARILSGDREARAEEGAAWVAALVADLGVPRLSRFGVTAGDLPTVAESATRASSMRANPVELAVDDLIAILERAL